MWVAYKIFVIFIEVNENEAVNSLCLGTYWYFIVFFIKLSY